MTKNTEKRIVPCAKCQYPLYEYACCCPMCGNTVQHPAQTALNEPTAPTRLHFWLANLRRTFRLRPANQC